MKKYIMVSLSALFMLTSCGTVTKVYPIQAKSGTQTQGTVKFTQKGKKVTLDMNVYKLKPNALSATHIHEFGDCSHPEGNSAGGHWNPTHEKHGKWGHGEHHSGDIGNLKTDKDGTARLIMTTDKWCLGCSDPVKNVIGKSIIIHAKEDDFKTQPTGDAGGRVGCVEIK